MSRVRPYSVTALIVWTFLLWLGRVPLAWSVPGDSTARKILATVPVVIFVALAAVALVALLRRGATAADPSVRAQRTAAARRAALTLVVWTVGYWLVRLPMISTDSHDLPFKAVHAVLATVSFALSAWVWRSALTRKSDVWESPGVAIGGGA